MTSVTSEPAFAPPPTNIMSPRRRLHDQQPPALSTTLSAIHRFGSHLAGHTPSSATSSTSPFNGYNPATFAASPTPLAANASPVVARGSNGAYNPRQWGSGAGNPTAIGPAYVPYSSLNGRAVQPATVARNPEDGEPPPPPYSPRRPQQSQESQTLGADTISPSNTASPGTNSSRYDTPISAATTISPAGGSGYHITSPPSHQALHSSPQNMVQDGIQSHPSNRRAQSASRALPELSHPLSPQHAPTASGTFANQSRHHVVALPTDTIAGPDVPYRSNTVDPSSLSSNLASPTHDADDPMRPPAARRAASTGGIGVTYTPPQPPNDGSGHHSRAWEPGMPLPPPPPGPPPAPRSQSMNRSLDSLSRNHTAPVAGTAQNPRRAAVNGPRLPPVPPTPSDWVDEDPTQRWTTANRPQRSLHIETGDAVSNAAVDDSTTRPETPGLTRSKAVRDTSAKGIRERRSESRLGKGRMPDPPSAVEQNHNPWADDLRDDTHVKPADLVLPASPTMLRRRPTVNKSTPRSARSAGTTDGQPGSAASLGSLGTEDSSATTRNATPQLGSGRQIKCPDPLVPTPPFSPTQLNAVHPASTSESLPSSPPPSGSSLRIQTATNGRPLSHILHTPITETAMPQPLMPSRPSSRTSGNNPAADDFARSAIERHQLFADKEAAASSDRERVQLFADFIVAESRIRRDRYVGAIDAMGSEILELTRDIFKPLAKATPTSPTSSGSEWSSQRGSLNSVMHDFTPAESPKAVPESGRAGVYMPSLSPIPSMSVSEIQDEMSSRGRPSSRWWEASQEGSIYGGGTRGLERSKRESKYMGLPLRDWDVSSSSGSGTAGPSIQTADYPPEKVGWHDETTPHSSDPRKLDVSRLVTLPPPYPRHYPAVNNNHPELTSIRTVVRSLNDMSEMASTKEAFAARCDELATREKKRRSLVREDIRRQVDAGTMSYAEAARVEESESQKEKGNPKDEFERFQTDVMKPLHSMLSDRIAQATTSLDQLKGHLVEQNPMEEGDEKPELLEKLTLLKWLFEAREQVHRELHELLSERNERYKAMVMAPYTDAGKIKEVQAFFAKDGAERRRGFETEALGRYEAFMDVTEENVTRGVEVQLSAFWDIAPALVEVLGRVRVARGVQTDGARAYEFSQQYLWEVLCHAEKSAYQFIEGQVNLLCLLHEVKSGVAKQRVRLAAAAASPDGPQPPDQDALAATQRDEEDRLTRDLKEKVGMVEKQWAEAMGQCIDEVKTSVRTWLIAHGGWDGVDED